MVLDGSSALLEEWTARVRRSGRRTGTGLPTTSLHDAVAAALG